MPQVFRHDIFKPKTPTSTPLKSINETSTKDLSFGNSFFSAGIRGDLVRAVRIYSNNALTQFKLSANGRVYANIDNHSMDLIGGQIEFFAPADSSKKMKASGQILIAGVTVLNLTDSFAQSKSYDKLYGRSTDNSFSITIPICCGIGFSGKAGLKGNVGFHFLGSIDRSIVSLTAEPQAELSGYAEAGVSIGGVAKLGVGGTLTLIKGRVPMTSQIGIWARNSRQMFVGYKYYMGYDLTMLKGRLYVFADICAPWVGCYRLGEENLANWGGFVAQGTIADGSYSYLLGGLNTSSINIFPVRLGDSKE